MGTTFPIHGISGRPALCFHAFSSAFLGPHQFISDNPLALLRNDSSALPGIDDAAQMIDDGRSAMIVESLWDRVMVCCPQTVCVHGMAGLVFGTSDAG